MQLGRVFLAACCVLALTVRPAQSDTFTLTDGFINYYVGDLGGASVAGPNISVNGITFDGFGRIGVLPGESVDWSGTYGFGGCGGATILGVTYHGSGDPYDFCGGQIRVGATLHVAALPFVAPPIGDMNGFFQTPFSLTGTIVGSTLLGATLFSVDVTGAGTITKGYRVIPTDPPMFFTDAPSLVLSETVAPTPEPSTIVLLCSGLGLSLYRRASPRGRLSGLGRVGPFIHHCIHLRRVDTRLADDGPHLLK